MRPRDLRHAYVCPACLVRSTQGCASKSLFPPPLVSSYGRGPRSPQLSPRFLALRPVLSVLALSTTGFSTRLCPVLALGAFFSQVLAGPSFSMLGGLNSSFDPPTCTTPLELRSLVGFSPSRCCCRPFGMPCPFEIFFQHHSLLAELSPGRKNSHVSNHPTAIIPLTSESYRPLHPPMNHIVAAPVPAHL